LDGGSESSLYTPGAIGYIRLQSADHFSLVDEGAAISGTGIAQTRWDTFVVGNLAPGHHAVTVTAGDHAPVDVDIQVAHADTLVHMLGDDVSSDGGAFVCFGARSSGRPIHSAWTFDVSGGTLDDASFVGCTRVFPENSNAVTVTAHADGLSTSVT